MLKTNKLAAGSLAALVGASAMLAAPSAHALRPWLTLWGLEYPLSDTDNNADCAVCHDAVDARPATLNPYGEDWQTELVALCGIVENCTDPDLVAGLENIEGLDSDGDPTGSDNITEINANTQPGWTGSAPAGVTGDLDPVPGGEPPTADPNGPYEALEDEVITFDGNGSTDPDGDETIVSYDWTFGDGAIGTGTNPTHAYSLAGTYNVTLTVTDDTGLTGSASTTATIDDLPPPPEPPVADPNGPYNAEVDEVITFDGSGSTDTDGTIVSYEWDFGDSVGTGTGEMTTYAYTAAGSYTVTLTVTDDDGLTDQATTTATITDVPPEELPPIADANGPYSGTEDEPVQFDGTGSTDPNGDDTIVSYEWNFGDHGGFIDAGPTPTHTYTADGDYTVTLRVTDDTGLSDEDTAPVTIGIGPVAPIADANGPYTGTAGFPVTFDASASMDANGDIATYEWDFGDGGPTVTVTTPTVEHTYDAEGLYDISLTVTDATDLSDSDATTADIAPPTTEADVFLTRVRAPSVFYLRGDREAERTITVFGDGTFITQDAKVTLTAEVDGDAVEVEIEPETVTDTVVPGGRETRFSFDAEIECEEPGSYEIVWMATIDAAENVDPGNDTAQTVSAVECRGHNSGGNDRRGDR